MVGCRRWDLRRLDPDDAVTLFQAQEVRGTRDEIQAACQPYGYHPLALRLLAGLIAGDPERPGDVALAAEYDWPWQVELVANPDAVLADCDPLVATADSLILDHCRRWLNLAREVICRHVLGANLCDLAVDDGCSAA